MAHLYGLPISSHAIRVTSADDLKPWVAFGSGGSKVETSDKPAEGGKDALSTGGAYIMQEKAIGD